MQYAPKHQPMQLVGGVGVRGDVQEKLNETMKDKWSLKRENAGKRGGEWRQKVCLTSNYRHFAGGGNAWEFSGQNIDQCAISKAQFNEYSLSTLEQRFCFSISS